MRRIIDISLTISPGLMSFPNNPSVSIEPVKSVAAGGSSNVSRVTLGSHSGTHVDPPAHFIDGAATVDELDLGLLIGDCVVADAGDAARIGHPELAAMSVPAGTTRLLIKTRNSDLWARPGAAFPDDYVAVTAEGARWIVDRGIRLVGIDFLSIEERDAPGRPVHTTLLGAGAVILEGLNLHAVRPGSYFLACLPLKVAGGDGAPARAALIDGFE